MKINLSKKLPNFILKLPKLLFWLTLAIGIISLVSIYTQGDRCNPPSWFHLMRAVHDFTFSIFLFFVFPLILLLFILSFFTNIKRKFLGWTLFLAILGLFISSPLHYAGKCPDIRRMADLKQIQTAENIFFKDHQRYADNNELENVLPALPLDPKTDKPHSLILLDDKQDYTVKAKLDRGGWYVCNKDGCEEHD